MSGRTISLTSGVGAQAHTTGVEFEPAVSWLLTDALSSYLLIDGAGGRLLIAVDTSLAFASGVDSHSYDGGS